MIYRKLFDWIDGDDACEATAVTLQSAHDPSHDGEQDFIIRRVKSLIETGVTIDYEQSSSYIAFSLSYPHIFVDEVSFRSALVILCYCSAKRVQTGRFADVYLAALNHLLDVRTFKS